MTEFLFLGAGGATWTAMAARAMMVRRAARQMFVSVSGSISPNASKRCRNAFSALSTQSRRNGREDAPTTSAAFSASEYLSLSDHELLRQCRVDVYRASGPGGQHRNKTDSAVRITHEPTRTVAIANESRSQHSNKAQALRRLRQKIALNVVVVLDDDDDDREEEAGAGVPGATSTGRDPLGEDARSTGEAKGEGMHSDRSVAAGPADEDIVPIEVPADLAAILPYDAKGRRNKRQLGKKHADYSKGVALLLELFQESELSISITAKKLSMSTGALSKVVVGDKHLVEVVNKLRRSKNLRPLRR